MICTSAYRSPGWPRGFGHALAAQPQPAAARRAGRHADLRLAAGRVDRDGRAERRLPRRQRQLDVDVAALDPVARVRRDPHDQVQVAGRGRRRSPAARPASRMRCPSATPAGMFTSSVRGPSGPDR